MLSLFREIVKARTISKIIGKAKYKNFLAKITGFIKIATPETIKILRIHAPIIFPTPILGVFFLIEVMVFTNSGKEVPEATMVSPIIISEIFSILAKNTALSTKSLDPKTTIPPVMKT